MNFFKISILASIFLISINSCSSRDESESASIIGTWMEKAVNNCPKGNTMIFEKTNTGSLSWLDQSPCIFDSDTFTYKKNGISLEVKYPLDYIEYFEIVELTNTTLKLKFLRNNDDSDIDTPHIITLNKQ